MGLIWGCPRWNKGGAMSNDAAPSVLRSTLDDALAPARQSRRKRPPALLQANDAPAPEPAPPASIIKAVTATGADIAEPARMTDTGNARLLIEDHAEDIRFNATAKGDGWMTWDGARWEPDPDNRAERWAKAISEYWFRFAEEFAAERGGIEAMSKEDLKVYGGIRAFAKRTENKTGIQGTLFSLRSEPGVTVRPDQWDAKLFRLTAKNKSYDLTTAKAYPHDRTDYSTRRANASITTGAACPQWRKFLSEIMVDAQGNPRPHLVEYLQRWCGYCLTGSTQEQVFAILWGKGSNGKSTFVEVLRHVLGDYAITTKAETLMNKDRGSGIPNDIAALAGARLVTAAETEKNKQLNEGLVKEITGGDTITARFLHKEFFEFEPRFKLMLTTNNKPVIRGTDEGIWRRIHLIPFEAYFKKPNDTSATDKPNATRADDSLKDKLKAEADGILNWMIEGARLWKESGLKPPEEVISAVKEYRIESDILAEFIDEHVDTDKTKEGTHKGILKNVLFQAYTSWCAKTGEHPMKQRTLTKALQERGWREAANHEEGRRWEGVMLKPRQKSEVSIQVSNETIPGDDRFGPVVGD